VPNLTRLNFKKEFLAKEINGFLQSELLHRSFKFPAPVRYSSLDLGKFFLLFFIFFPRQHGQLRDLHSHGILYVEAELDFPLPGNAVVWLWIRKRRALVPASIVENKKEMYFCHKHNATEHWKVSVLVKNQKETEVMKYISFS